MKRIKKISRKNGKINISYDVIVNGKVKDEYSLICSDIALPELYQALDDLNQDVVAMCELPDEDITKITVTGASFSYHGENHTLGATITAQKKLIKSNQPLILNTPHKVEDFYGQNGDFNQLLDADCIERLKLLQREVEKYIDGNRLQADLLQESGISWG